MREPTYPRATMERKGDALFVHTICRECSKPLILPCHTEDGYEFTASQIEEWLKWADLIVCNSCHAVLEEQQAEKVNTQARDQRTRQSGIPASFKGLQFEDMDITGERIKAVAAAQSWAECDSGGLLLWGPPGSGKTRLAATAVWKRLERRPVTWCSVAHLIASLQAAFSDNDRREALKVLTGNGALVLDDLDKIPPSQTALSQLFVAVDRRVSAGAALFVTANAPPQQLSEKFGEAIVSRLFGYCRPFKFDGVDRRLGG